MEWMVGQVKQHPNDSYWNTAPGPAGGREGERQTESERDRDTEREIDSHGQSFFGGVWYPFRPTLSARVMLDAFLGRPFCSGD